MTENGADLHWHRSRTATSPRSCSICEPQPAQLARPHFLHVIALHIPPRVSGIAGVQRRKAPRWVSASGPTYPVVSRYELSQERRWSFVSLRIEAVTFIVLAVDVTVEGIRDLMVGEAFDVGRNLVLAANVPRANPRGRPVALCIPCFERALAAQQRPRSLLRGRHGYPRG